MRTKGCRYSDLELKDLRVLRKEIDKLIEDKEEAQNKTCKIPKKGDPCNCADWGAMDHLSNCPQSWQYKETK